MSSGSLPVFVTVIVKVMSSPNGTDSGQDFVTSIPGTCVMSVSHDGRAVERRRARWLRSRTTATEFGSGSGSLASTVYV